MTIQGSKAKYAKYICPIIQKCIDINHIDTFIDCFVGGANIIKNIKCKNRIAIDNNKYLIALWQFLQKNPNFIFPPYPSREEWDKCKNGQADDWYIGFVSIFCSYATRGFPGGYSQTDVRYQGRIHTLEKDLPLLTDVQFVNDDYTSIQQLKNSIIYCDPPYKNTKSYNYKKFNTEEFWNFCREISKNNFLFISEQTAPDDFIPIWSKQISHTIYKDNRTTTEKSFYSFNTK